jgi:hypothetical protein
MLKRNYEQGPIDSSVGGISDVRQIDLGMGMRVMMEQSIGP